MKKFITPLMLTAILSVSCSGKKESKDQQKETISETIESNSPKEINIIDSVTVQLEATKTEIEESAKKLDDLLNDIQ